MFLTTAKDISAFLNRTYYKAQRDKVFEIKEKVVAVVKRRNKGRIQYWGDKRTEQKGKVIS